MHQAGSDSMLTAQTFFRLVDRHFSGLTNVDDSKFRGELYGLGNHTKYKAARHVQNHNAPVHQPGTPQLSSTAGPQSSFHQPLANQFGGYMNQIDEQALAQEAYS